MRRVTGFIQRTPNPPSRRSSRASSRAVSPHNTTLKSLTISQLCSCVDARLTPTLLKALGAESAAEEVNEAQFERALLKATEGRIALKRTLQDYMRIMSKLQAGLTVFSCLVLALIWGVILDVNFLNAGTTWLSLVLAFSFCFGDTIKRLFEGLILVFVWHPFSVSDRVFINDDNNVEMNLVVSKINLLNTEFIRSDGQLCILSNGIIQQRDVRNVSRAPFNCTVFFIKLRGDACVDVLTHLHTHLEGFRGKHWRTEVKKISVQLRTVYDNSLTSTAVVVLTHSQNFENDDLRFAVHDAFARRTHTFLREANVCHTEQVHLTIS
jgi:hypothetical protein